MSNYFLTYPKLIIKLEQHTPIIHFQHDQPGASLRGSELKPKLDRFLSDKINKDLYRSNGKLDYKVKILGKTTVANSKFGNISDNDLYFGNMGKNTFKKKFVHSENTKIHFFSFNYKILDEIKKHFEAFLANHNFGARQNKGFGSFYIKDKKFDKNLIDKKVDEFKSSGDFEKMCKKLKKKDKKKDISSIIFKPIKNDKNFIVYYWDKKN